MLVCLSMFDIKNGIKRLDLGYNLIKKKRLEEDIFEPCWHDSSTLPFYWLSKLLDVDYICFSCIES